MFMQRFAVQPLQRGRGRDREKELRAAPLPRRHAQRGCRGRSFRSPEVWSHGFINVDTCRCFRGAAGAKGEQRGKKLCNAGGGGDEPHGSVRDGHLQKYRTIPQTPGRACARVRPVGGYVGGGGRRLKGQEQLQKGKILINEGPKDL